MAYAFYLDGMQLPVTPEAVQTRVNGKNETMVLMDHGEVNILRNPGLSDVSFDALFPNVRYPFAAYPDGFRKADFYLGRLGQLMAQELPFQLVVSRMTAGGTWLFGTSLRVSLEEYTMKEEAGRYGTDVLVSLKMKQYRDYGTKTCRISGNTALIISARGASGAPGGTTYTASGGESLWEVAQRSYGDGSRYGELQAANGLSATARLSAGDVISIPR